MKHRILIFAPRGRDAQVVEAVLRANDLGAQICDNAEALLAELEGEAAAAVITEEVLDDRLVEALAGYLARQPAWSDFPFVVLALKQSGRRSAKAISSLQELGNLVLLERPVNPETLASAARSALRARRRQYETRRHLIDLRATTQAVERLNAELEHRIAARTADLAGANDRLMREIAERERLQSGVVQGQKMEAIGRLTGGIAHDFNNLLHVVNLNLQFILRLAPKGRLGDYARRARESVDRGARLTAQLLSFARTQSLLPKLHDANALVHNLSELVAVSVGAKVKVSFDLCDAQACVMVDGAQLEMALLNMTVNARDAMPEGGSLTIRTVVGPLAGGAPQVLVSVQDTGCGIPAAVLPKVFDPFFTTKPDGAGTGLGLSQVYGFAKQSGGSVDIASELDVGTTVTMSFPLAHRDDASAEAATAASAALPTPQAERRAEILVVEDDAEVRQGITEGLRLLQFVVREAPDGASALRELQRRKPDLLISDFLMPGMNGAELVHATRRLYPDLPILMATGYADMAEVGKVVGARSVLKKPFTLETLGSAVGEELARARVET